MQVLHQTDTTPPKGWNYEVDGTIISAASFQYLVNNVRSHYHSIDQVPPKNLELVIMDSICERMPVQDQEVRCRHTEPPTWSQLLSKAAYALSKWTSKGFPLVTEEQLLERRNTCMECSFWNGESAFGIGRCDHAAARVSNCMLQLRNVPTTNGRLRYERRTIKLE